ncbi:MAG: type II secretion system F family protein [Candidatus Aenigmarchaeota archaeon]|nr:type II secretion system F family protein [Candidatus Aenigmarchaeota archaeon]
MRIPTESLKFQGLKIGEQVKVILIPLAIAAAIVAVGVAIGDAAVLANLVIIATFVVIVPYFISKYTKLLWLKNVESQFPNFVRDLADSQRSGMSFAESIDIVAASASYGKLTPEVLKMKNRLSWGTHFIRVLEIFGEKVKGSRVITEALAIIKQSYESGGSTADTLDAVARDIITLREADAERQSLVKQNVAIMYGLFFMFMGISIMIIYIMVPIITSQEQTAGDLRGFQFTNPCDGVGIFPCDFFYFLSLLFGAEGITAYYISLFFSIVLIQGIFTGLIAGQLGEDSVVAGGKHALIMVISAILTFLVLTKSNFLPLGL